LSVEEVKAVKPILDELGPKLNAYLSSIGPVPEPQKNAGTVALISAKDK
jgi:hypothetical protein